MNYAGIIILKLLFYIIKCEYDPLHGESRILGGEYAKDGEFPYQASLRINNNHFCAGSVLNEHFVITAAHCLKSQNPNDINIIMGTNHLNETGEIYKVEKLFIHEQYSSILTQNDIGLIRLKTLVTFNRKIKSVSLPLNYEEILPGTELVLTGWGRTSYPGNLSESLKHVKLNVISNQDCQKEHFPKIITSSNICTYTKEKEGACHGDSGGPLVDSESNTLVGIVSWGKPCGVGKPDVFTRVSSFLKWIDEKKNNC